MYKSLLRKIEFLALLWKVSPLHFLAPTYSPAHMRLSACLLGVFSPNTAQQRCTVCPTVPPPDTPPVVKESGEREAGSKLGHGCRGRGSWRWRVACLSNKWVNTSESWKMTGRLSGFYAGIRPRRFPTVTPWMVTLCVCVCVCHRCSIRWICCSTVGRKFESWVESPPLTEERELAGEWKKRERERERGYSEHDSFPSLSACLDLNTLSHSRWEKCLRPSHCWPPLSSFLFAIKCISNGTSVQGAFLIRQNSIAFNLLLLWLCNFWGLLLWELQSQNISMNWKMPRNSSIASLKIKLHLK